MKRRIIVSALVLGVLIAAAITAAYYSGTAYVMLSTTTSFDATGFLGFLNEYLKERYKLEIRRTAVGTTMALIIAARGDSDGCIVHAPAKEFEFRKRGNFAVRKVLAYNFFIIAGPADDPANVSAASDAVEAFYRILQYGESSGNVAFVSRGDQSGTHLKEQYLRGLAIERYGLNLTYDGISSRPRYLSAGAGMAETLMLAQEKDAYTLSDIGTYLTMKAHSGLRLERLYSGDRYTLNVYSIMVAKNPKHDKALRLAEFLANEGQRLFAEFGKDEYGYPLFFPARPLLEAYKDGELVHGTHEYVPPDLSDRVDDLTLAERIFEYAFRDVDGDGNPDRSSGR